MITFPCTLEYGHRDPQDARPWAVEGEIRFDTDADLCAWCDAHRSPDMQWRIISAPSRPLVRATANGCGNPKGWESTDERIVGGYFGRMYR